MKTVSAEELQAMGPQTAILNIGAHAGSHEIRNAIRYRPHDLLTPTHLAIPVARENAVIVYDEDGSSSALGEIVKKLESDGFTDVRVLDGGFKAWKAADGAMQEASIEQVVPPMRPSETQELDRRI